MLFPKFMIEEMKKQENRDLTRFGLDYDLPEHFLPGSRRPSFSPPGPTWGTSPRASW